MRQRVKPEARRHNRTGRANRTEGASTFVLFPVCVLIVLFLATTTIDASMAFLGAREVNNAANAAANDAAGVLGKENYLGTGDYTIDENRIAAIAGDSISHRGNNYTALTLVRAERNGVTRVRVEVSGRIHLPFRGLLPGVSSDLDLRAVAYADAADR